VIPEDLRYSKDHEWVRIEGDLACVGITDYAQGELGDIVFVELPKIGARVEFGRPFGTIEAVKAVSDLFAPATGEVVEINTALESDASIVNSDPFGDGWMIKIKMDDPSELSQLLDASAYGDIIG
jgi:glycine cleavage system H protein